MLADGPRCATLAGLSAYLLLLNYCSLFSTLLLGQLLVIDNQTYTLASFHYSCGHLSESGLNWQSLATELFADMAPRCISDLIFRTADVIPRWYRQSSNTYELVAITSWLTTVEDRPFANGRMLWVSLPEDITSAPSLPVFRRKLKTHLFW